jgi:hypothetical protein
MILITSNEPAHIGNSCIVLDNYELLEQAIISPATKMVDPC